MNIFEKFSEAQASYNAHLFVMLEILEEAVVPAQEKIVAGFTDPEIMKISYLPRTIRYHVQSVTYDADANTLIIMDDNNQQHVLSVPVLMNLTQAKVV